jgi:hypothetical protein
MLFGRDESRLVTADVARPGCEDYRGAAGTGVSCPLGVALTAQND